MKARALWSINGSYVYLFINKSTIFIHFPPFCPPLTRNLYINKTLVTIWWKKWILPALVIKTAQLYELIKKEIKQTKTKYNNNNNFTDVCPSVRLKPLLFIRIPDRKVISYTLHTASESLALKQTASSSSYFQFNFNLSFMVLMYTIISKLELGQWQTNK